TNDRTARLGLERPRLRPNFTSSLSGPDPLAGDREGPHNEVLVPLRNQTALTLVLGAALLGVGPSAGTSAPELNVATSQAFAVQIIVPNQPDAIAGSVAAPKD